MIYWLDNCDHHAHSVHENCARELLELFSLGVGNYTETDVREASRAFTGWTISYTPPRGYYNRWDWQFERSEEHTSELQSLTNLVCRLLLEKKKKNRATTIR